VSDGMCLWGKVWGLEGVSEVHIPLGQKHKEEIQYKHNTPLVSGPLNHPFEHLQR